MVGDHDICCVEPINLVGEQICSLVISIVGNNKSLRGLGIAPLFRVELITHNQLEHLGSLAARSCTHVENGMVRFDIAEYRRHHTHQFLPCDQACIFHRVDNLMYLFEIVILLQELPRHHQLIHQLIRVELFTVQF